MIAVFSWAEGNSFIKVPDKLGGLPVTFSQSVPPAQRLLSRAMTCPYCTSLVHIVLGVPYLSGLHRAGVCIVTYHDRTSTMPYSRVAYRAVFAPWCTVYRTVSRCGVLYRIALWCTVPYRAVVYRTVSRRVVPYRITPWCTVPYRAVVYRTVPRRGVR